MESSANAAQVFEYKVLIRESHLDTFGHVNNAVYLQLFEEARWEIINTRGYGLEQVLRSRIGPTILEVRVQFRREIRNRELITIRSWVEKVSGKIMSLKQVMVKENGEEACVADFTIGLFDLNQRRLIEPTEEWKRAVGLLPLL